MTLKGTPDIVTAAGIQGLTFTDEVKTANKLVPVLRSKGVKAIVVLIHQGGLPKQQPLTNPKGETVLGNPEYDYTCAKGGSLDPVASPILDIASHLDPEIDMVVSGHTHQPYVCDVKDPKGNDRLADLGLVVRASLHRHRAHLRPGQARHRAQLGRGREHAGHP